MFINFNIYKKYNLTPEHLIQLLAVKQKQTEEINIDILGRFEELGYVTYTKGKKNQDIRELVRLSDKGKKLVKEISTDSKDWTEDEEILYNWLSKYYEERNKQVGNPNRVKKLLRWFSLETGIYKNNLVKLISDFLNDEYVDESSKVLEFCLFYPKKFTTDNGKSIAYEAKPDIFDSWLFKHYQQNKERLEKTFEEY